MELRIYCRKGNCQNMIRKITRFGGRVRDIIYMHGWIERPGIGPVCKSCQEYENKANFWKTSINSN